MAVLSMAHNETVEDAAMTMMNELKSARVLISDYSS
jgi:hypothetical protein